MPKEDELWHLVEAKRDDGSPTIFRIREIDARHEQTQIFVAELPYPVSELSRLPDAPSYRRFATFEEQWLDPACKALGWTPVAVKIEDGSFFIYLYGDGDPMQLVERLSPFDGELGFFDEPDPTWEAYSAFCELLAEAKTLPRGSRDEIEVEDLLDDEIQGASEHTKTTLKPVKAKRRAKAKKPAATKKPAKNAKTPAKNAKTPAKKPAKNAKTPAKKPAKKPAAKKAKPAKR